MAKSGGSRAVKSGSVTAVSQHPIEEEHLLTEDAKKMQQMDLDALV
jgi:hypothetical protein